MSKVAQPAVRFTPDYDLLPEGMHVELIDGELLKMAEPTVRHSREPSSCFSWGTWGSGASSSAP